MFCGERQSTQWHVHRFCFIYYVISMLYNITIIP